jgi:hypothetical protein
VILSGPAGGHAGFLVSGISRLGPREYRVPQ